MLVQDCLQHSAVRWPDKVALVCQEKRITYAALDALTNRLAHALADQGVQRGDRVVLYQGNSVETVAGIFAILKAGGVFVLVHPTTKPDKLVFILNHCQAVGLFTDARGLKSISMHALATRCPALKFILHGPTNITANGGIRSIDMEQLQAGYPSDCPARINIDLDLACLIYTSGSTGEPKGVMSDHSNVIFAASSITEYLHNTETDVVLNVLPLSFDYGLYQVFMVFQCGGTLVLESSFAYPAAVLQQIERERVTGLPGVPTLFALLVQMDLSVFDLSSIRYLTNTAAALPPSHIQKLRQQFPQAQLYSMYGLTETKRTLYLPPEELDRRPGSVGRAIPGTEVWLEDTHGHHLGPGEVGELVVRGRHVMRGYWADPIATTERFRPGPLPGERLCYTGDLFRFDDEGFYYFVGRRDDLIKSRGEKVAPKEIENVLYELPGVVEAAVVGVPDMVLGQAIKAFLVVSKTTLTEAEVLAHCRTHLEDHLVPQQIEFCNSLPKTVSGKINKQSLQLCVA